MNGQVIMASHADFTNKQSSLDVSNLTDGIYIIKIVLESGESKVMKFVKMH